MVTKKVEHKAFAPVDRLTEALASFVDPMTMLHTAIHALAAHVEKLEHKVQRLDSLVESRYDTALTAELESRMRELNVALQFIIHKSTVIGEVSRHVLLTKRIPVDVALKAWDFPDELFQRTGPDSDTTVAEWADLLYKHWNDNPGRSKDYVRVP